LGGTPALEVFETMKRLQDQVILVTGGSSGLGATAALLLAEEGAKVAIAARRRDKGEEVLRQIEVAGGEALFVQADVMRRADIEAMTAQTIERFGRLDGAVNNAGITGPTMTPIADIDEEGWDAALNTNLKGVWLCMKYQIPAMLKQGKGSIVNMSSIYGLRGSDLGAAAYCASKFGVIGLTKTAAIDYADKGIRVNAVCPGFTHSEMVDPYVEDEPELMKAAVSRHSAMNRLGESSEVAEVIAWLLSDTASFVSGAALPVGGGDTTRLY
jgi:NAD(P)-dependent dehydrogenase (short-subunit alcohol dehydrogenase family)